jgi:hypothetical protein
MFYVVNVCCKFSKLFVKYISKIDKTFVKSTKRRQRIRTILVLELYIFFHLIFSMEHSKCLKLKTGKWYKFYKFDFDAE